MRGRSRARRQSRGGLRRRPSTGEPGPRGWAPTSPHCRNVTFTLEYLVALGEARSCLAALSDAAGDESEASHYERLLIAFDVLEPKGPATWQIAGDRAVLLGRMGAAVEDLIELGGDPCLTLILALARA